MNATKRRILNIVGEIDNFEWYGSPIDDLDGIFLSLQSLSGIAERLRASAALLPHPPLQSLLGSTDREQDPFRLRDKLQAAAGLIRDAFEDFGDDLANWKLVCDRDAGLDDSEAAVLRAQIAELKLENADLLKKLKDPATRRLASYQRCVLVMAITRFGFRPNAARQETAVKIASASGSGSLEIGDDTVRSVLNEAVNDLEIDQTEVDDLLAEVGTS